MKPTRDRTNAKSTRIPKGSPNAANDRAKAESKPPRTNGNDRAGRKNGTSGTNDKNANSRANGRGAKNGNAARHKPSQRELARARAVDLALRRATPLPWSAPKPPEDDPEAPERIARIMASQSYRRADQDPDFMELDQLRGERLELEYLKPEIVLQRHEVRSTIVVFGSTRLVEPAAARRRLEAARRDLDRAPRDPEAERRVAVAERVKSLSRYYDEARSLARIVSTVCQQGGPYQFVVMTGGGPGIMEAANRGAFDVGAKSVGLNINLPHEQYPNPYITPELCFQFRYFALRKMHFMRLARALVAFPGGYGTLDEVFDALCLIQTQKIPPLPVILVGREFWKKAFDPEFLASEGVIDAEDVHLFTYAETGEEAWERIVDFWRGFGEPVIP